MTLFAAADPVFTEAELLALAMQCFGKSGQVLPLPSEQDQNARTPASAAANHFADRLRLRGVLASTDGPDNNVLMIKQPMVFGPTEAAILLTETETALATLDQDQPTRRKT